MLMRQNARVKLTIGCPNRFRKDVQPETRASDEGELGEVYFGQSTRESRKGVPTWVFSLDKENKAVAH